MIIRTKPLGIPRLLFFPAYLLLQSTGCFATPSEMKAGDAPSLADYSLEQLMDVSVEVTSAARKPQKLEDTAAAIHVITQEDIRRSGMTNLPELLRMVPGMQVARIDGSTWAISSRGFNAKNSDNLLVMLDGRVLQTPTFTGVYWDAMDVVLEDIERIEVVRGPGGTLWGANAVSGVINITSKSASATQGGMASGGGGNYERQGTMRYGGKIGEDGHFRIYARDIGQDNFKPSSSTAHDQRDLRSAGFRADWGLTGGNSLTVQGDTYTSDSDHTGSTITLAPPASTPVGYTIDQKGGNLLTRWKHALSATSEWTTQFYYDYYERRYQNIGERRDTYDLDFQHRFLLGDAHDIVWGLGYRQTSDQMENTFVVSFNPASRTDNVVSTFFQDEIALSRDSLYLTVGSKFEHNHYSGFEYQPNLRLRWKIDERHTAWTAVSRAVHTPSRTDANGQVAATATPAGVLLLQGNPEIKSEHVLTYEAGYRIRLSERSQMDAAVFYAEHNDLMTIEPAASYLVAGPPAYTALPRVFFNKASATTRGLEWNGSWRPTDKWQFKAAYTWLKMDIHRNADSGDTSIESEVGRSPQNQFQLQVFHSPTAKIDLSASLYYVDSLPSLNIPAYTRMDARVGWRVQRDLELSLTGRNLFDPSHPEFINSSGPRTTEIPRSVFGAATWRF
ncbi:MAG: TonB-dependent receptor [Betaproteobacteria bacterium]|nr:TonB-dependent receptor [Betaproteobacteria bacterium]